MDESKGSHCSTNASDDCSNARAGGVDSCSFALGEAKSLGKATQVYRSNLTPRSECKSSAALQSCWVQRLNLFTSTSDAEEEGSGRKHPGKHIHVRSHFAKDFSSCRRDAISHSRSLSWPPDGPTVNEEEEVLRPSKLPSPFAGRCDSGGPCNRMARERSPIFSDGNLLVPCEEAIQSCGVDSKTENLGLQGENRSHRKAGSPREALVPCLQNQGMPYRTNETLEKLDVEDDCKSQNLGTRHFRRAAGDSEVSLLNPATGEHFSRLETGKHLLSLFGSESITASPTICRSDCHREMPSDLVAKERFLSMFVPASKVYNRGARADADRRLLVSPADIRKDKVMGRPKRAATDVVNTVDAEKLNPVDSPVEFGDNTAVYSNAPQTTITKDRLRSERLSNRETSGKNVTMRSEAGNCIDLLEQATDSDKRVAENRFLFSHLCTERVWHGQSEAVVEKQCGADSKPLVAFARHHSTLRSCVPERSTKECWSNGIHDFEDSGQLKPAESFSSTGSLPLNHQFEEYNLSFLKETNSPANDTADWRNEWMSGLHGPVKAGVGIHSPCESPQHLSFPWLGDDSRPLKEGKQQIYSKENHPRGGIYTSIDEESCEKFGASTSLPCQNLHFLKEAAGRMALQADNKYAARIKQSEESLDLHLPHSKQSPKSRFGNGHRIDGVPSAQQAWIQRWSSFLNAGSGSVKHATEKRGKLSSDFPEKVLASNCLGAVFPTTPSNKGKSYLGCIGQSSREHSREGSRNMDGTVAHVDCGFKYIFESCLPSRTSHVKYASPKAQAMVGAARQMDPSPVKDVVFSPSEYSNLDGLQNKGIPGTTSCSSGGNADVDMDILEFLSG